MAILPVPAQIKPILMIAHLLFYFSIPDDLILKDRNFLFFKQGITRCQIGLGDKKATLERSKKIELDSLKKD